MADGDSFETHLRACLAPILGRHMAGHAIKLARSEVGRTADAPLMWHHARATADFIQPMLRTLIGRVSATHVCGKIANPDRGGDR